MTGPPTTADARISKKALFSLLGYRPHPGQIQVHRSAARRRVVACGVRWGKTLAAAAEGICAAMTAAERSIGWVVGPTYDLADRVFREMITLAAERMRHRIVTLREHDRRLVLRNLGGGLSEIRGKSADNPVSLLGEGLDWLIVDEAARLRPYIWESHLSQRLIDKRGWALLISTPRGKGWYYDAWKRGQGNDPDYESWNLPSWSNPLLDAALIEQARERLPERVFRQEYGGEFLEGSGSVFRGVREVATGTFAEPVKGQVYYGGLDLAKVEDYSVLVLMDAAGRVVFTDRFHRLDWSIQAARVAAAAARYNQASVLTDTTGSGEPVFEVLRKAGARVRPYPFTASSKSALIDHLVMRIEQRQVVLPKPELWPVGIDEIESFEFSVAESGHVRTGAPSGMHDDCVIALALAAWRQGHRQQGGFEIL